MPACIDRRIHLRVKIKSLAYEAATIRQEEKRHHADADLRSSLREHRIWEVRREQRASLLAYAFIRGRRYSSAEPNSRSKFPHRRVAELVKVFGPAPRDKQQIANEVQQWSRADLCGQDPELMTPEAKGSTPFARSNMPG